MLDYVPITGASPNFKTPHGVFTRHCGVELDRFYFEVASSDVIGLSSYGKAASLKSGTTGPVPSRCERLLLGHWHALGRSEIVYYIMD